MVHIIDVVDNISYTCVLMQGHGRKVLQFKLSLIFEYFCEGCRDTCLNPGTSFQNSEYFEIFKSF